MHFLTHCAPPPSSLPHFFIFYALLLNFFEFRYVFYCVFTDGQVMRVLSSLHANDIHVLQPHPHRAHVVLRCCSARSFVFKKYIYSILDSTSSPLGGFPPCYSQFSIFLLPLVSIHPLHVVYSSCSAPPSAPVPTVRFVSPTGARVHARADNTMRP